MKDIAMNEIPKWDVALENLAREEYEKTGQSLDMDDFKQMGKKHRIRFDDLMHTLCQLVVNDVWTQQGEGCNDSDLEALFVYNRLDEKIAEKYSVHWQPAK